MNLAETHDLLTFIASVDNRRFDDATVLAWHPIVEDLAFDDCRLAVIEHFGTSDAYLMPVHVKRIAVEIGRDRRRSQREALAAIAAADEAGDPTRRNRSEAVRALIAELRDALPEGDPDKLRRSEWIEHDRRQARLASAAPNPDYDPDVTKRALMEGAA